MESCYLAIFDVEAFELHIWKKRLFVALNAWIGHMDVTRDNWGKNCVLLHDITNVNTSSPENGDFRQFVELAPPVALFNCRVYFKQLPFYDERLWLLSAVEKKRM